MKVDSITKHCDMCRQPFGNELFDASTRFGKWGYLCRSCFKTYGLGLGVGKGQFYIKVGDEWINPNIKPIGGNGKGKKM